MSGPELDTSFAIDTDAPSVAHLAATARQLMDAIVAMTPGTGGEECRALSAAATACQVIMDDARRRCIDATGRFAMSEMAVLLGSIIGTTMTHVPGPAVDFVMERALRVAVDVEARASAILAERANAA